MHGFFILLLTVFSFQILAAELPAENSYADHYNFIGSGIRGGPGLGPSVFYSRRVTNNFLVGVAFFWGQQSDNKEGGSLDTAQYYKEEYKRNTSSLELNTTYYFRSDGYAKWGPLLRGGIGHSHTDVKAHWGRYDRDPAVIVIGDEKRLLESGETSFGFNSTFIHLAGFYQFLWGFKAGNRVGHILEIGLGAQLSDSQRTVGYTKPNGQTYSKDISNGDVTAEFTYIVAF